MSLWLSTEDLHRYERASRAMLAPLEAQTVDVWRQRVNETVRDLVGGDESISLLPAGERLFLSEEAPALAQGVESFLTAYTPDGIQLSDPVVNLWQKMRRASNMESFSWASNAQMIGAAGYRMHDSPMVSDVLASHGVSDFVGLSPDVSMGDVLVWVLFRRKDRARFGEQTLAVLRTLLPPLKAGLEAMARFDAQRHALDHVSDAIVVFGVDRRELHRNAALTQLLAGDPDGDLVSGTARSIAHSLHPLLFPGRRADHAPGSRTVTTRRATYALQGTLLPPGAFGAEASVMVTIQKRGVELPQADTLRARYGLTAREAEIALLLAEGMSNADIAERLFLSPHTARRHTANIYDKLGVSTRKGLALLFLQ